MSTFDDVARVSTLQVDTDKDWAEGMWRENPHGLTVHVPADLWETILECLRNDMSWSVEKFEGVHGTIPEAPNE